MKSNVHKRANCIAFVVVESWSSITAKLRSKIKQDVMHRILNENEGLTLQSRDSCFTLADTGHCIEVSES